MNLWYQLCLLYTSSTKFDIICRNLRYFNLVILVKQCYNKKSKMEYFARICCQANDATGDSHKKTGEHGYITIQEGFIMKTSCLEGTRYVHEQEIQFVLHYYLLKDTQNSRPCYGCLLYTSSSGRIHPVFTSGKRQRCTLSGAHLSTFTTRLR